MIWNNAGDFFAMGGYGLYVWGSVMAVFGFIVVELIQLILRRKNLLPKLSFEKMLRRKGAGERI